MCKENGWNLEEFHPEGGESWLIFRDRVRRFLEYLKEEFVLKGRNKKVLLVAHGGVLSVLRFFSAELNGKEYDETDKVKNCSICIFRLDIGEDG
mmetsp:Transcript_31010/g.23062  ORF Transcript_31010/g.23062 Transcript_31010/m.23062 type:complete len:94 (+) Transcript_31010:303-584(+)